MTTLPIDGIIEAKTWMESTVSAAQRTLDNILYTTSLEATEHFAHKIQEKIDAIGSGVDLTTSSVLALSQYVKLLEDYENSRSFCVLKELSIRMNSQNPIIHNIEETIIEQAS